MRKLFLFLGLLGMNALLHAQQSDSAWNKKISDEILTNGRAYENLRVLTKQVGARLAGSAGMVKAEQWGLKTMKESGANQAWLQECMVPHWIRGGKDEMWSNTLVSGNNPKKPDARLLRTNYDIVALGNSVGTGPAGVSGEVMLVNYFDELEKRKDEVKGMNGFNK